MAYFVDADSIADAWLKAVCKVWFNGHLRPTEHKNFALTLDQPLVIHVNRPMFGSKTCDDVSDFKAKAIEKYNENFLKVEDSGFDYTYPNRLFDFPEKEDVPMFGNGVYYSGDGLGNGFNQIDHIVEELSKCWYSRRQIAHTWYPKIDAFNENCPCLQDVQFLVDKNALNVVVHFRSNDILDGWLANCNGIYTLQDHVGRKIFSLNRFVGGTGYIETYSTFPHIYENRLESARKVVNYALKKFSYSESERLYDA